MYARSFACFLAVLFSPVLMAAEAETDFRIEFALAAGGQTIDCQTPALSLGKTGVPSRLKDARFYLHDLRFLDARGQAVPARLEQNEWQYLDLALVDLENAQGQCAGNKSTHAVLTGKRQAGEVHGIQFTVGVPVSRLQAGTPVSLNHSNTEQIAAPLDIQAMAWNWQAGRKFMKIELAPEGGVQRANDNIKVWPVHLGSTGCVGNPASGEAVACSSPNRFAVRLVGFDPARDKVVLDLGELFAGSDPGRDEGGAAGCMSSPQDPECVAIFEHLGLRLLPSRPDAADAGQPMPGHVGSVFKSVPKQP